MTEIIPTKEEFGGGGFKVVKVIAGGVSRPKQMK